MCRLCKAYENSKFIDGEYKCPNCKRVMVIRPGDNGKNWSADSNWCCSGLETSVLR